MHWTTIHATFNTQHNAKKTQNVNWLLTILTHLSDDKPLMAMFVKIHRKDYYAYHSPLAAYYRIYIPKANLEPVH